MAILSAFSYAVDKAISYGKTTAKAVDSITNKASRAYNDYCDRLEKNEKAAIAKRHERLKRYDLCLANNVLHKLTPRKESPELNEKGSPIHELAAAYTRSSLLSNFGNQLKYVNEKYEEEKKAVDERLRTAKEAADAYRKQSSCA
jgi:hypothetical protein